MEYHYLRHNINEDETKDILIVGIDLNGDGLRIVLNKDAVDAQAWVEDVANMAEIEAAFALNGIVDERVKEWIQARNLFNIIQNELDWLETNIPLIEGANLAQSQAAIKRLMQENREIIRYIKRDMRENLKEDRI